MKNCFKDWSQSSLFGENSEVMEDIINSGCE